MAEKPERISKVNWRNQVHVWNGLYRAGGYSEWHVAGRWALSRETTMANVHRSYSVRYQGRFLGHSVESVKALSYRRVQDVDTLAERPRWAWHGRQLVLNFSLRLNCRRRRAVHVCAPTHTHALLIFLLKCSLAQNELYQHTHARTHARTHTHTHV